MQLAANLSLLFPAQTPWHERCQRTAAQGFKAVEILFPYNKPATQYKGPLQDNGLQTILINTPNQTGSFGYAALAGKEARFRRAFDQAFSVAQSLGAGRIHIMAGILRANGKHDWQNTLINNLHYALEQVSSTDICLQLEALNHQDFPDYAYTDPLLLLPIFDHLDHPQLGLQFDFYHTLMQGYELLPTLEQVRPYISHIQIADPVGRHEPDFTAHPQLLEGLQYLYDTDYDGWVGLEYRPRTNFEDSLGFLDTCRELFD